jgi:hypothetical protein
VSLYDGVLTLNGTSNMSNIDLHEIYITNPNTVVVTANNVTQADLRSVGGPRNGWVVDSLVYESTSRSTRSSSGGEHWTM